MSAEELLVLGKPALLPLIGQTQINQPDRLLPKVVESLKTVSDDEMRGRLFTELMALMNDEEMLNMLENLIEKDELLMDTPFLRRIRTKSREDGLKEGLEEGLEKGRQKGDLNRYHQDILKVLALRFEPPVPSRQHIEQLMTNITDDVELDKLLAAAVQSQSIADFQSIVERATHL